MKKLQILSLLVFGGFSLVAMNSSYPDDIDYNDPNLWKSVECACCGTKADKNSIFMPLEEGVRENAKKRKIEKEAIILTIDQIQENEHRCEKAERTASMSKTSDWKEVKKGYAKPGFLNRK
jgi:hypothetical protein